MTDHMTFDELVSQATGDKREKPYPYQSVLAEHGLPELLAVPTGTGKTMAAVLPWLYRRRFHPDATVRSATPRRLVFVLPMRVLVEQTAAVVRGWLAGLGLEGVVDCEVLMGGEPRVAPWRAHPERDAVIIGTLDMVISRSLNRGFGESRFVWPIDFGLFNNDCHFVYDEVQLMGPALATSRQLQGLREALGTAAQCSSTWMSATVPERQLCTFDAPEIRSRVELTDADMASGLAKRLGASKRVLELSISDSKRSEREISQLVADRHKAGTLTIVVLNTVERARTVFKALEARKLEAELVLLHSRFRPGDRKEQAERALTKASGGPGRIVVSTQVIEAGVDVSASLLVTEAAPWPSIVQRAGRCNRDGLQPDAQLVWFAPGSHEPYEKSDVAATVDELQRLEDVLVTSQTLRDADVSLAETIHPVLRRKDLIELFDTLPDLTGNDIDVSRFIRQSDELDLSVVWRSVGDDGPAAGATSPGRNERCQVSVGAFKKVFKAGGFKAWRYEHLSSRWVLCRNESEMRPGMVVVVDSSSGHYTPTTGWDPDSKVAVEAVVDEPATDDESTGDDPASIGGSWLSLKQHLADTEREIRRLFESTSSEGLADAHRAAAVQAARLHDIGKAHDHFQQALKKTANSDAERARMPDVILAKGGSGRLFHKPARPNFRHELVSALALLGEGTVALDGVVERDLAVYLVAAHHGRIRMGLRAMPDDLPGHVLGVKAGDQLPAVEMVDGEIPMSTMDLSVVEMGERGGRASWSARALDLRDRPDLGPFRLGFLEAMVRLADWAASARPTIESEVRHG
jgi:CRISPR-associated endonuclease/helicase Cas3